jgi:hypothetical protein
MGQITHVLSVRDALSYRERRRSPEGSEAPGVRHAAVVLDAFENIVRDLSDRFPAQDSNRRSGAVFPCNTDLLIWATSLLADF